MQRINFDALLLKANGTVIEVQPDNGTDFTLEEMYKELDCELIEIINTNHPGWVMVVDEEGTFNPSKRCNVLACALAPLYIVGDALFCRAKMIK